METRRIYNVKWADDDREFCMDIENDLDTEGTENKIDFDVVEKNDLRRKKLFRRSDEQQRRRRKASSQSIFARNELRLGRRFFQKYYMV